MSDLKTLLHKIDTEFMGKATMENSGICQYLTEKGKKCLIGLFIPDGHEAQHASGTVYDVLKDYTDLMEFMPSKDLDKLERLQTAHDFMGSDLTLTEQKEYLKQKSIEILGG